MKVKVLLLAEGKSETCIDASDKEYLFLVNLARKLNENKESYGPYIEIKKL